MCETDHARGVEAAIAAAGSGAELARRLGITRFAVQQWKRNGVPAERVPQVARITGLPFHALRPDLYDPPQPQRAGAD